VQQNWLGKFQYGSSDSAEQFEFSMRVQMIDGTFTGRFLDSELAQFVNVFGEVIGQISDNQISFVFKYPFLYDDVNGEEVELDLLEEGHEVIFIGNYNATQDIWSGEWIITGEFTQEELEMNRGLWEMCNVDELIHFNQNLN